MVELPESEKPIEFGRMYGNVDPLSIVSSHQHFVGTDFLKDPGSKIRKDHFDSSPLEYFTMQKSYRCDDRQIEETKLLDGDRQRNDDYFPQGEEYEEEIGTDEHQLDHKNSKKQLATNFDDEYNSNNYNKFQPMILMVEDKIRYISRDPLTRFITHIHSPFESGEETMLMSKTSSDKNTVEKLQTLIEKTSEFKRRVFRSKTGTAKSDARTDVTRKKEIIKDKSSSAETTNRSSFQSQQIPTSEW